MGSDLDLEETQMSDKKYFVLMENGKDTSQVFASKQPRGAALKAATRGHTNIRLRERGTNGHDRPDLLRPDAVLGGHV